MVGYSAARAENPSLPRSPRRFTKDSLHMQNACNHLAWGLSLGEEDWTSTRVGLA